MATATPQQNITLGQEMAQERWSPDQVIQFLQRLKFPPTQRQQVLAGFRKAKTQA